MALEGSPLCLKTALGDSHVDQADPGKEPVYASYEPSPCLIDVLALQVVSAIGLDLKALKEMTTLKNESRSKLSHS